MPAGYCRNTTWAKLVSAVGKWNFLARLCSLQDVVPRQRAPVLETNTSPQHWGPVLVNAMAFDKL
jgi:hypothetical protein